MEYFWTPTEERVLNSSMFRFFEFLGDKVGRRFDHYGEVYRYSIDSPEAFWGLLAEFLEIVWQKKPSKTLLSPKSFMGDAIFFPGAELNFAQNLLKYEDLGNQLTICFVSDGGKTSDKRTISELKEEAGRAALWLRNRGIKKGDRVAAVVSNTYETLVMMLATSWLGAVWSSCSPDFGVAGILDRFSQINPSAFLFTGFYRYNGKEFDCLPIAKECVSRLDGLLAVVELPYDGEYGRGEWSTPYHSLVKQEGVEVLPEFEPCDFRDPLYIMFSSGTTGKPKCIIHGVGGTLVQHLKELSLHTDLGCGDTLLYFTTCGWMMWNWMASSIGVGSSLVLYDGSPSYPDLSVLWRIVSEHKVSVFGTSPKFLGSCMKAGIQPKSMDITSLKTILSTGAPLLPEHMDWVQGFVGSDILLSSISGGTDIISCFMLGNPTLPVVRGEIQCLGLGMAVESWDDNGNSKVGEKGELVCVKPFVSMPIGFIDDDNGQRYRDAYFEHYAGTSIWRHGDYIEITEHGGVIVFGRSDTTLNPGGVRIGTAEIYRRVESLESVIDSLVIAKPVDDDVEIWLFLKLRSCVTMSKKVAGDLRSRIRKELTPRHVPHRIFSVADIPYTRSGKKVEVAVLNSVQGMEVVNISAIANPSCLEEYRLISGRYEELSF